MSEILAVDYSTLVKQVYIDPIRTVVVVDDDFPTLDGLLNSSEAVAEEAMVEDAASTLTNATKHAEVPQEGAETSSHQPARSVREQLVKMQFSGQIAEVQRVKALIELCRQRNPPWMVDVHDGRQDSGLDELQLAPSLHHSDLMILDFHLTGDDGDGSRAIEILKKLAYNDQFNLVVVYTKGISGSMQAVYQQIAVALAHRDWAALPSGSKLEATRSLVLDWEDEDAGISVNKQLLGYVSTEDYLRERSGLCSFQGSDLEKLIQAFLDTCPEEVREKSVPFDVGNGNQKQTRLSAKSLYEYAIVLRHQELLESLSKNDYGNIACAFEDDLNWIRLDKIFITVVNKVTAEPHTLETCLLKALEKWAPGPHQLLMAQMRAQLSEKGVGAEGAVLANRPLQAGWLHELLDDAADAESVMTQSINRHWEALGDIIYRDVKGYAKSLFDYFRGGDRVQTTAKYMPSGVKAEARLAHLNYYYSTKPVDSLHLTTGQVFEIAEPDAPDEKMYWVCLSPACDLVPGQKKNGWKQRLGSAMPFIAVLLERTDIGPALKDINQNRFVLVQLEESIQAFKFTTDSQSTSLPVWEQMFANNAGEFDGERENDRRVMTIQRMRESNGGLVFDPYKASIVCQLRYEYALNLLQRLAGALSRVGLDFRSL